MHYRNQDHNLSRLQFKFRELWAKSFGNFNAHRIDKALEWKEELLKVSEELRAIESSKIDMEYFTCLHYLVNAIFLSLQGYKNKLAGNEGSEQLAGAQLNIDLFLQLVGNLDQSRPSVRQLIDVIKKLKDAVSIDKLAGIISELNWIELPVILTIETHRYAHIRNSSPETDEDETDNLEKPVVISVQFYLDAELWANPQLVKPQHLYSLSGLIKLNNWPEGYDELKLTHVSTTDDSWFILSLPTITFTKQKEIPISGNITLKYAQSTLDVPLSIKMLARFTSKDKIPLYPLIIGYDQLILRVIDPGKFDYPTGYNKLNEKALAIQQSIEQELKMIPKTELENFIILLSAILNYQGFCFQFGEYKNKESITEDEFRDNLIKFLSANPHLASTLIKEGNIAGGRVEINFNGIIAELKVEKQDSDRKKIIEKHVKQPAVYASATSAELSILCVLDLTEKIFPSSIAAQNVFLESPVLHGFENTPSTSRVAVIIIDGNTKNPSSY